MARSVLVFVQWKAFDFFPSGQKRRLSKDDILREDCHMAGIRRRQTHENRTEVSPDQEAFLSS